MKGARPGGKRDAPPDQGGDQLQLLKLGGVDEIAMRVLRHRDEQEARAKQHREGREAKDRQKRLGEIRNIVRKLRQCCWPEEFRWPDKNDLERLDDLVSYFF